MPVGIKVSLKGIKEWQEILKRIPYGVKGKAMRAFAEYFLGNDDRGLRHEPAYKYVSRKRAYGRTFFSDKQRRWFFANTPPIGNYRTHKLVKSWSIGGDSTRLYLKNPTPYASLVIGEDQARQPALVGWRKAMDVINSNMRGALAAVQRVIDAWISGGAK